MSNFFIFFPGFPHFAARHQEERPKTERGARSLRPLELQIGPLRGSYDGLDVGILGGPRSDPLVNGPQENLSI